MGLSVPHVDGKPVTNIFRGGTKVTTLVKADIQPVYFVPRGTQQRDKNRSDVATISCNKDPHAITPRFILRAGRTTTRPPLIMSRYGPILRLGAVFARHGLLAQRYQQ